MFGISEWITNQFLKRINNNWPKYVEKAVSQFEKEHPDIPTNTLREKLSSESSRISIFGEESVLKDSLSRAKYNFFVTVFVIEALAGLLYFLTPNANINLYYTTIANALTSSLLTVGTSYNTLRRRILGGLKDKTKAYLQEKLKEKDEGFGPSVKLECSDAVIITVLNRKNTKIKLKVDHLDLFIPSSAMPIFESPVAEIKYIPPVPPISGTPANDDTNVPESKIKIRIG